MISAMRSLIKMLSYTSESASDTIILSTIVQDVCWLKNSFRHLGTRMRQTCINILISTSQIYHFVTLREILSSNMIQ
ncbi:CLUMA_CG005478, isoform A [Clunio marinus]|uniref:CLUMA_CG005478, isoform A n=1 Tax=Clunio marinus TaxID=568069 RepID=A0A1J1I0E2_9DIPT|nr:CLUMA_CG005478, isoform A [Clunio marinus]